MKPVITLKKKFRVVVLSKCEGSTTTYWCTRSNAIDFLDKYSEIDLDFLAGIVQAKVGRSYETIYSKTN
jgi:hypothetical protein